MLTESEYLAQASGELRRLVSALDDLGELIDPEFSNEIITIEFEDGAKFVINSHRAARQIWMAAQRKAWHFDYDMAQGQWWSEKEAAELWGTLSELLTIQLKRTVQLVPSLDS